MANALRLQPSDDPGDRGRPAGAPISGSFPSENEDLAYKVEIWDVSGEVIEQVLAVTSSPSIGYAAYYAATREYPDRYVTLRHKNSIVSRWNGPGH